ncbi:acyl carrier protein [Streptococcus pneumoniae]|uniref:phosphopantetheine-binding protein n=1 Tax=Streptococcus pneumoniae TaxID=1313 RepID=UPI0007693A4A|nr:phosphopantetheine-binding protein [Streptococcus pneumoniae]MDS5287919.1 phosphopantetheine-binding protein [Streptococcus pneumoniae]CZD94189.1 acyl carrier protein [Streptococcus pneumoniae]CZE05074.1 acyl carrier protein [Streptococcus pneumoniae]VIY91389.1 acyl carrier protein [Streptococcus pneumoniae]VNX82801.1 peptidase [Streptococcus pneumoniae]
MKYDSEIKNVIKDYIDFEFDINEIDNNVALTDYGVDSLKYISIILALEYYFKIEIPDNYLVFSKSNTIKKLNSIIEELL